MSKRVLFIDRDGTLIKEAPPDYKHDQFSKLVFYKDMFFYMRRIAQELDYELVMVSNQDGLGREEFPEGPWMEVHQFVMQSLENEGIHFSEVLIDRSFPEENLPTRKPGTGMLARYINNPDYDLEHSFVIGDRITDMQLAANLGCKGIWINEDETLGSTDLSMDAAGLRASTIVLETLEWQKIYEFLKLGLRRVYHKRETQETEIEIYLNTDGTGKADISTGLGFFDHMLHQIARHGMMDLHLTVKGDLHVDEHHTIEDTGLALGEAMAKSLADKKGMERYGFALPMDDSAAQVSLDFGGRPWLVWEADFKREKIGDMPTEMFRHFFKSFSDASLSNLNIKATGQNEHHKIEAIFKAFAKAIKMAVKRDPWKNYLPSTKGML